MGKTMPITARIREAITKFKDGKVGKMSKGAFKVELAAFLKKTDKRITLRHLEMWVAQADNAWILDIRKVRIQPPSPVKRVVGATTRLQSRIAQQEADNGKDADNGEDADNPNREEEAEEITRTDESCDSSSDDSSCACCGTTRSSSRANENVLNMMLMPSIAIAPQIEEESIVEEMCNPDPVEDRHEKNVPMDDVEKNSEIKGPTGCVENDSVQNLADPVQNTGFEDTSSVLNNADPDVGQNILSENEVYDFFAQLGLAPLVNPLPTDNGSSQGGNLAQMECNQELQNHNIEAMRPVPTLPTFTMPLPPISSFFNIPTPTPPKVSRPPSRSFSEVLQVLSDRAQNVVPVQPTQPSGDENVDINQGTGARITEILSSLKNVVNVLCDANRAMEACGRMVQVKEIKVAEGLFRGYARELVDLTRKMNAREAIRIKKEAVDVINCENNG